MAMVSSSFLTTPSGGLLASLRRAFVHFACARFPGVQYWVETRVDKLLWSLTYRPGTSLVHAARQRAFEKANPGVGAMGIFPWEQANGRRVVEGDYGSDLRWSFGLWLAGFYRANYSWHRFWECECPECLAERIE